MELITEAVIVCKKCLINEIQIFKVGTINLDPSIKDEGPGLTFYRWRERYANNEKFFAIGLDNYNNESTRDYIFGLIENNIESPLYTYVN